MGRILVAAWILLSVVEVRAEQILAYPFSSERPMPCGFGCYTTPFFHAGVDFDCDGGTTLYSAISGTVTGLYELAPDDELAAGCVQGSATNFVTVTNGNWQVKYLHCATNGVLVSMNQQVQRGEAIALSGNSGYTCGSDVNGSFYHLHFEVQESVGGVWYARDPYTYNGGLWIMPILYAGTSQTYAASWSAQTPTDPSGILHLGPNETVACSFTLSNTGTASWTNNGASPDYVELHSVNSAWTQDQASSLAWNWLQGSSVKIATTTGNVAPGGQGVCSFSIRTPATAGTYTLHVSLYHPNSSTYLSGTGPKIVIDVVVPPPPAVYTAFTGKFDQNSTHDIGLYEETAGTFFVALADVPNSRFVAQPTTWLEHWGAGTGAYKLLPGDFSGDGYTDLCLYHQATGRWFVAYNQGGRFEVAKGPAINGAWLDGWAVGDGDDWTAFTGDYSGDGVNDVGVFHPVTGRWFVAYNQGGRFQNASGPGPNGCWLDSWGTGAYGTYRLYTGKLSVDTYDDIGAYHSGLGRWFVAYNWGGYFQQANGPATGASWLDGWAQEGTYTWRHATGQAVGDSHHDLVVMSPQLGRWFVAQNLAGSFAQVNGPSTGASWLDSWAIEDGSNWQTRVADVSGDGYVDLVAYTPNYGRWFVAYNWGDRFTGASGPATNGSWLDAWGIGLGGGLKPAPDDGEGLVTPTTVALASTPNPFNARVAFTYTLPRAGRTTLSIYDLSGRLVATLLDRDDTAGKHRIIWDAANLPSSLYLSRLIAGEQTVIRKVVLLK